MPSTLGASARPMVRRRRLWFVWEQGDGNYRVQPLNALYLPMAEPRTISGRELAYRFTLDAGCPAVPPGYVPEDSACAPDADMADAGGVPDAGEVSVHAPSPRVARELRADDPDLLRVWLEKDLPPPSAQPPRDGFTPAQEAEMAMLLEEGLLDPLPENPLPVPSASGTSGASSVPGARVAATPHPPGPEGEEDPERALRAAFALGLLQLKQGRKEEGAASLERVLAQPRQPLPNGSLLFSEFGVSLRRLGLISLAMAAHRRALEFSPDDARVHFNLARGYHDLNDFSLACKHLERALEIAPDFAQARQFLAFLQAKDSSPL